MLVLTRRVGESIVIGEKVRLTILRIKGRKAKIGIEAPRGVTAVRQEVHDREQAAVAASVVSMSEPLTVGPFHTQN